MQLLFCGRGAPKWAYQANTPVWRCTDNIEPNKNTKENVMQVALRSEAIPLSPPLRKGRRVDRTLYARGGVDRTLGKGG